MGKQLGNNMMFDFSIGLEIPVSVLSNMEKKRDHAFSHFGAMESISSMKMMAGENFPASSKALQRLLTLASHFTHNIWTVN